jgi:hypothetical protein
MTTTMISSSPSFTLAAIIATLFASSACSGTAQELGGNGAPSGSTPNGASSDNTPSAPSLATGSRTLAQMDADATPRSDLIGVAFIEAGTRGQVGFVIVDREGKARSDAVDLGEGASPEAGVAVTVDPTSARFYVAWAEGASTTARIHIHAIGFDASVKTFTPYPLAKAGAVQGMDLFATGNHLLISGFVGSSELFFATVSAASAKPIDFQSNSEPGATAPRTNIHGVRGDCEAGEGCMLTIRDAAGAHPKFGMFGSPAIGMPIAVLRTTDSSDPAEIGRVEYQLGATYEAHEGGDSVRVASDGDRLVSIGVESVSGKTRLQGSGRDCGAVTLRGCENPTDKIWRDDFDATTVGGNANSAPMAVALDESAMTFALTSGVAGDVLVFGSRPLLWPKSASSPSSARPVQVGSAKKASVHTLSSDVSGDPVLLKTAGGWAGVWIEGSRLFVRAF